jgi:hypothetical protein
VMAHGHLNYLVHGVVLVVAPGQIPEHVPRELVDTLDDLHNKKNQTKHKVYQMKKCRKTKIWRIYFFKETVAPV